MTRKLRMLIVTAIATTFVMPAAAVADTETFTVNNTGDGDDLVLDGTCEVTNATGDCTMRAALQETNDGDADMDTIHFNLPASTTLEVGATTALATATIDEPTTIDGCSGGAQTSPCVGIRNVDASSANGLINFNGINTTNSVVRGLALSNAGFGIRNTQGPSVTIRNNWFGVKLDGTADVANDNAVGVELNQASMNVIGGSASGDRNVFANNNQQGLRIFRSDNNQVMGNYFGVKSDGTTVSANGENIEVAGFTTAPDPSTGNAIGGTLSGPQLATAACDGPCNVIAGATDDLGQTGRGIDLNGDGGVELPAETTTISGNAIGLDSAGTLDKGNEAEGVFVGAADNVTVGGATTMDRNSIGGNGTEGIESGAGATGLAVSNNFIGLNSAGTAAIPDTSRGVDIAGGTFSNNRLGGDTMNPQNGGLRVTTGVATVTGNVFGVGVGGQDLGLPARAIAVESGGMATIGGTNPGDPNVIGNTRGAGSNGIELGTDANTVIGNYIGTDSMNSVLTNDGRGLIIYAGINNQIGGLTGASENVFSNNTNAAIEMITDGTDMNRVFRNFGSNNGLFLDLAFNNATGQGPGNPANGPNEGIQAPTITAVNSQTISGTAGSSAVVRIYRTNTANGVAPTDIIAFAGVTTADGGGNWSLTFPAELPVPGQVTANQTNPAGSSSEFTNAMSYLAAPPPPTQTPTPTPLTPVATAPDNSAECAALRAKLKKAKSKRKKRKIRAQLRKLGC